jgi:predicted nucleic acid-binding protein
VTEAELLVRPHRTGDWEAIQKVGDFLSEDGIFVVEADRQIARTAAVVRTTNRIGLGDALIIATAMAVGCDVIIGNDKDWARHAQSVPFVLLDDLVNG